LIYPRLNKYFKNGLWVMFLGVVIWLTLTCTHLNHLHGTSLIIEKNGKNIKKHVLEAIGLLHFKN